jgi:hypothetical protein
MRVPLGLDCRPANRSVLQAELKITGNQAKQNLTI